MSKEETLITENDLENLAAKAGEVAAKVVVGKMNGDEDYMEDDDEEEIDEEKPRKRIDFNAIKRSVAEMEEFDIFEDIGAKYAEAGATLKYTIYKGGKMFTTEEHPYSWEQLQKERGAGTYKVNAKTITGQFVKSQTRTILDLPEEKRSGGNNTNNLSPLELIAVLEKRDKAAREENARLADEQAKKFQESLLALKKDDGGQNKIVELLMAKSDETLKLLIASMSNNNSKKDDDLLKTILPLLISKGNDDKVTPLIMEMQKSNMTMLMEMQKANISMIKEMNEKHEQGMKELSALIASAKNSDDEDDDDELSPLKVHEMIANAEEKGEKRAKELYELIDAKAEEKAQGLSNKEPDSAATLLIKNLLPAIVNAGMAAQMPNVSAPQIAAPNTTTNNQPRRSLTPVVKQPVSAPTGDRTVENATKTTTESTSGARSGVQSGENAKTKVSALDFLASKAGGVAPVSQSVTMSDEANQERIVAVLFPILVDAVSSGKGLAHVPEIVEVSCTALKNAGIDLKTVERDMTADVINSLIAHYGLPVDFQTLLREFHHALIEATR